jgi:formylmethanofuran--tetrahydromethanopterin N-formyltransferase
MQIGPTVVLDTHAEAFAARYARLVITAVDDYWVEMAVRSLTGYGTSVIGCDAEAGVERLLRPADTPDGRPGAAVMLFNFSTEKLAVAVAGRVGQCVLTCPTTACFNGLPDASESVPLGKYVRFFGDGNESQESRAKSQEPKGSGSRLSTLDSRLLWRIPVMDGEFLVDDVAGVGRGIAGGNLILHAESQAAGLEGACRAIDALRPLAGVITPFPGGVSRAGSKVGSKYKNLVASTQQTYCPTLRDRVETELVDGATCAYEIVIDGVDEAAVGAAMLCAMEAAAGRGVLAIGAGNYAGRLGKHNIRLHDLLRSDT